MRTASGIKMRVASRGVLEFVDAAGAQLATVSFAIPGSAVSGWTPDDEDLLLATGDGLSSRLRVGGEGSSWILALTVDNLTADPVPLPFLGLGITLGAPAAGWAWTTDLQALVVVTSRLSAAGGVLLRLKQGFCRAAGSVPAFAGEADGPRRAAFHLAPPDCVLGAHRRHQVVLEVTAIDDIREADAVLPAWLPPTVVRTGTGIDLSLPDMAVVPGPGVRATMAEMTVRLDGLPGHRLVGVHGPRGVERLELTWCPGVRDLVPGLVEELLRTRPAQASDAAGYVVAHAAVGRLCADPDQALDWLDQVDWLDRGSLLADATAGLMAATTREWRQLDAVWRFLGERPVSPGYGLAVTRLGVAGLGVGQGAETRAATLLGRQAEDPASDLELALLTGVDAVRLDGPLAGLVHALGGGLPGRPIGLSASEAALAVSLLKLCPESWRLSRAAGEAASKAEGLLLADYTGDPDQPRAQRELDGLAWLLLGDLGI